MQKFINDTAGAITIDWVALTAGVLVVGITLLYAIYTNGMGDLSISVNSAMSSIGVGVSTGTPPSQASFVE